MTTKTRRSKSRSSKPARNAKGQKKSSSKGSSAKITTNSEVDFSSPTAMENIYYIAHNAADCLTFTGFGWQNPTKKKGRKQKGKKKK